MNDTLQDRIKKDFCPDGIWQLGRVMKSLLGYSYYTCLYSPQRDEAVRKKSVA